jgi:hypothetical protein
MKKICGVMARVYHPFPGLEPLKNKYCLTDFLPHGLVRLNEAFSYCLQDVIVVLRPKGLLPDDEVHEMLLKVTILI